MPNIAGIVSFSLKRGVSEQDFLQAHKEYNQEFVSKQKGYISHQLLVNGNIWSDLVVWETMEDTMETFQAVTENPIALKIMEYIDQIGEDNDIPLFTIIKSY